LLVAVISVVGSVLTIYWFFGHGPGKDWLNEVRGKVPEAPPAEVPRPSPVEETGGARVLVLHMAREKQGFSVSLEVNGRSLLDPVQSAFLPRLEQELWEMRRHRRPSEEDATRSDASATSEYVENLRRVGETLAQGLFPRSVGDLVAQEVKRAQESGILLDIIFASADEELLSLPLEAVRLPGDRPLGLEPRVRLFRRLSGARAVRGEAIPGPLRILVAVGSPDAQNERVELLDMERELRSILDALEPAIVEERAIVEMLEVGSLHHIREALEKEPFHVLHVSCHGVPGKLILEKEDGSEDRVTPEELAERLTFLDRKVQLVFLASCLTGVAGREGEGAGMLPGFAQGLLKQGIPAVVAMQAPVGDRYATDLAASFYRHLSTGESPVPSLALARARQEVEEARLRRIEKGESPDAPGNLPEWATPALYLAGEPYPLYDPAAPFDRRRPRPEVQFDPGVCVRRIGDFIGRRREVREMARALRNGTPGVLLFGMGGVGKSSLAAELVKRLRKDGGAVASVAGETSLHRILEDVGRELLALSIERGEDEKSPLRQWAAELRAQGRTPEDRWASFLRDVVPNHRILLLLDNFEDNLVGPSREREWKAADRFPIRDEELAKGLALLLKMPGRARVVITSRYPIELPGRAEDILLPMHLGPLSPAEGRKLMLRLEGLRGLPPVDKAKVFIQVGGHPRALEYLDAILQGGRSRFDDVTRRLAKQLQACGIDLAGIPRDLDAALGETIAAASEDVLLDALLERLPEGSLGRRLVDGASVYRRPVDRAGLVWQVAEAVPKDAAPSEPEGLQGAIDLAVGLTLLTEGRVDGETCYMVHRWTARALAERMSAERLKEAHLRAGRYWDYRVRNVSRSLDEHIEALEHLLEAGAVDEATPIAEAVCEQLDTWGRWSEGEAICHRMIEHLGEKERDRAAFTHRLGVIAAKRGDYKVALNWFMTSLRILEELGDRASIAATYHALGNVASLKGDYDGALDWYRKSLAIEDDLGHRASMAGSYHQLGVVAELRGDYDDALDWYRKSLAISEELGDRAGMARSYHQLGRVADDRGDYNTALQWYRRSLAIKEELGDRSGIANSYGQLGIVAHKRGDYKAALEYYTKSLDITEELGDRAGMAASYHALGNVASLKGDYDGALDWYRKALIILEELGERAGIAATYHALGNLAYLRGDYDAALDWYRKSLAIKEELGDRAGMASTISQLGILAFEQGNPAEAITYLLKSFSIRKLIGVPDINIDRHWLGRVREAIGEKRFNELVRKQGVDPAELQL